MDIMDDRGLCGVIYGLMMGAINRDCCPGLNVLIMDETQPGGLWDNYMHVVQEAKKHFLSVYPDDREAIAFTAKVDLEFHVLQDLCVKMGQYCLRLAPLLQSHYPRRGPDEDARWNRLWADGPDLTIQEKLSMVNLLSNNLSDWAEELMYYDAEMERIREKARAAKARADADAAPGERPAQDPPL